MVRVYSYLLFWYIIIFSYFALCEDRAYVCFVTLKSCYMNIMVSHITGSSTVLKQPVQANHNENSINSHNWLFVRGSYKWLLYYLHKGPLMWKAVLCYDFKLQQTRQIRTPVLRIPPAVTSQAKMKNWLHECQKWVSHMIGQYAHI